MSPDDHGATPPRGLLVAGPLALLPPTAYALASEHGRPFMLGFLFGPDSNHSLVGLVLLAVCLVACPVFAFAAGWRLRRGRRRLALGLMLAALALLTAGLTTRQPYQANWTLGPGASAR